MKCSCIDIGSNTIKASVFEKNGMHWKNSVYLSEQTGLVKYLENGILNEEGIVALCSALKKLVKFSLEHGADRIFAFATAALRSASNIEEIKKTVFCDVGIQFEVISAEEEALCSLRGLLLDERCEGIKEGIMIDMGGGSTEIVYFSNGKEPQIASLPFGCLSLTQNSENTSDLVLEELQACTFIKNSKIPVFLIGGTARAIAILIGYYNGRNKTKYKISDFKLVCEKMTEDDFVNVCRNLIPKRVHTIVAGAVAMHEILKYISSDSIYFSDSGVREGYLEKILM